METALIIYAALVNLLAFILCVHDKRAAIAHRSRIPERTLFAVSIIGGALGMFAAMLLVRHKTRKWYFMLLMPVFIAAHIALAVYLFTSLPLPAIV